MRSIRAAESFLTARTPDFEKKVRRGQVEPIGDGVRGEDADILNAVGLTIEMEKSAMQE